MARLPWRFELVMLVLPVAAVAAQTPADTGARAPAHVDSLVGLSRAADLTGIASSASEGVVGAADIAARPLLRPGELVENIPGVIVTQHSGSGKANQYFLRGFNLDHGTDLAIGVDGVPVNMPSHAHGQGYADLNYVIPELVEQIGYRKGPHFANVGDFGAAGALDLRLYRRLPAGLAIAEGGGVGYARVLVANNASLPAGNLIYAAELEHNDGPWDIGDDARKGSGLLRYATGNAQHGVTLTAMAYHNDWHATDQVPDRAIASGLIDRWGTIDSTDGGRSGRYSLDGEWHTGGANGSTSISAYALHYDLDLFSDFTYFLEDPVHGDQIEQQDRRWVTGMDAEHRWTGKIGSIATATAIGLTSRADFIDNGLYHTEAQVRLDSVTVNQIDESEAAPWVESRIYWTPWLRTIAGLRADLYRFDVTNLVGGSSGIVNASLLSPKLAIAIGPFGGTEFYLDGGEGFHSNDARGVVAATGAATPLVRGKGGEVGVRTAAAHGLRSSVSLWLLDLASELVWDGDEGGNEPSGPTRRYGAEWTNNYTPLSWLTCDADYAWSHARFTDHEAAGDDVPEALVATFDGGVAVTPARGPLAGWRFDARVRYFGPRPLTQDDSVRSAATTLVYAGVARRIGEHWSVGLDAFNLLNNQASDIDYYYVSRLPGEPLSGVADIHTHPAEGRELRLSVSRTWASGRRGG